MQIVESNAAAFATERELILPEAQVLLGGADHAARLLAFAAADGGMLLGAVIIELAQKPGIAHLRSIVVRPGFRRRGIGRRLLGAASNKLKALGHARLLAEFMTKNGEEHTIDGFLQASGFTPPLPGIHIRSGPFSSLQGERWLSMELPGNFEIAPWADLTSSERVLLREAATVEYPEILSPFEDDAELDASRSLLLRYRGQPVGWMLLEELERHTLLFKTMYVFKRHQRMARGVGLFAETVRRIIAEGRYPNGMFFVEHENEPMRRFMECYFISSAIRKETMWRSYRTL